MAAIDNLLREAKRLYEETNDPSTINTATLTEATGLLGRHLVDPLKLRYDPRKQELEREYNITPPYIALLREEVTGRLPFIRERKVWKRFKPSIQDWARYIRLPTEITSEVAEVLAIYLTDGALVHGLSGHHNLAISGKHDDSEFYRKFVIPRINRVHNLQVGIYLYDSPNGKYPKIYVRSKAVYTWLKEDLIYPDNLFSIVGTRQEFFDTIIASQGYIVEGAMHISSTTFIEQIALLAKQLGFSPTRSPQFILRFPLEDTRRMNLLNPKHRQTIS